MSPSPHILASLPAALACGGLGVVLGLAHFQSLRWNLRLYLAGRRLAAAIFPLRLAMLGAVLILVARAGAWALLLTFAGLMVGRLILLRTESSP